ncbi:hypothetical protein [Roseibium sp. MMSF_3544]|uniref:hypothetical protein n=1 Tax=unclassified Roseibium TaxID=2629323 RepID=UPI00273EE23A|nr:hypothetical protein [Roseibium sp. MMSF_3544]
MTFLTKRPVMPILFASFLATATAIGVRPSIAEKTLPGAANISSTVKIHRMERGSTARLAMNEACQLRVDFGSYASGIDGLTFARVLHLIATDGAISEVYMIPWGREGEETLCIYELNEDDAKRLFETIREMIPQESSQAWTTVVYGEDSHSTAWPN